MAGKCKHVFPLLITLRRIVPVSAHAAFAKAASYFKIKIHIIPVDPVTRKVNLKLVRRAINPNTILLVGSAVSLAAENLAAMMLTL